MSYQPDPSHDGPPIEFFRMPVDDGMCAVVDCPNEGAPQVCLYDGRYHRHGYIHYENGHRWHPRLQFRSGAWHGICDRHYETISLGAGAITESEARALDGNR